MAGKLGGCKTIVAVGLTGLLCTVLGGVMIFVVPQLIRNQILQISLKHQDEKHLGEIITE